ncbi:D-glycero-beta-D-manno-heptose 1-phosphate adenylyltransferase [Microbacterium album]|uniref:Bifunctional protein HldE n=1 Tax=Microbacterium album TaxID=2053191 RepID=A0A917MM13_9MICO|nr:D-glycero-beta-D-manno-heptose 1-phosphate adenylyltransferase [Microbacterium album]GGH45508.1 bifunctional protein HldE [Microbacterium album]
MGRDPDDVIELIRARAPHVLVVGDAILDRWLHGTVRRLSREAPVPVVDADGEVACPGGAANTAANLAALGARVRLVAEVGDDADGRALRRLLDDAGVDTSGLLVDRQGSTASKTRIVGDDQILVRVDRAGPARRKAATPVEALLPRPGETLVVCDYGAGMLDDGIVAELAARRPDARVIVDAHDLARWATMRPDVVTPNGAETEGLLGRVLPEGSVRQDVAAQWAGDVLAVAGASAAIVTLDRDGTVVIERTLADPGGAAVHRTRARPSPEHQATGAGDTFVAAIAVATAAGATLPRAADFAQQAADVVVSRSGTAVCSLDDLGAGRAGATAAEPVDDVALRAALTAERERGRTIVFTNGCFDLLHLGHTRHLQQASELGDVLVVALNDDASVRRLKGPGRPVNPVEDRARVLAALECVDYVTVFSADSPAALLEELRPDIYAKGGDYTPQMLAETTVVQGYGGEVRILDYLPAHSTTEIVARIAQRAPLR